MFIRPNWRDPEPYKSSLVNDFASNKTVWEFLRRNPEYQADSKKFLAEVYEWCFNNPKDLQETFEYFDCPSKLSIMLTAYEEICSERHEYWLTYFNDKWLIPSNLLPDDDSGFDVFISLIDAYGFHDAGAEERFKPVFFGKVEGPLVLIPVDLSTPLETLLQMVEGKIRELREAGIKQGTVKPNVARVLSNRIYIEQLRILDAIAAGATVSEIGEVLSPGEINDAESKQRDKRIKAAYQAALKMQNKGYLNLLNADKFEAIYKFNDM
ncbi:MAG: DUF2285 domain-containing protein [Rhodoferax sp.]|uniref:DNA -binding domain-containing protein n=1 Tax=Rhodoferax sp. TaxID=50421 RepID=UPI003015C517